MKDAFSDLHWSPLLVQSVQIFILETIDNFINKLAIAVFEQRLNQLYKVYHNI